MIYSINQFRHYLLGQKFTIHVDHLALLYLVSKQELTEKLAQWTLLPQEFEFNILHRPGVQYSVTDNLSRLELGESSIGVFKMISPMLNFLESTSSQPRTWRKIWQIYVSRLHNPPTKIGCRISWYYHWSHFKNGVSTLSDLSNQQLHKPMSWCGVFNVRKSEVPHTSHKVMYK